MPKLKTKSSAKKRFSATGTGKLRRHHAKHRHNLTKQAKKVKRNLRKVAIMDETNAPAVRRWMPYI